MRALPRLRTRRSIVLRRTPSCRRLIGAAPHRSPSTLQWHLHRIRFCPTLSPTVPLSVLVRKASNGTGDAQAAYETFVALSQAVKRGWQKLDGAAAPLVAAAGGGPKNGDAAAKFSDAAYPSCKKMIGASPIDFQVHCRGICKESEDDGSGL